MINVVIADDQKLLRENLKSIIEQDQEITVTGLATNGLEAVDICDQSPVDLVLMNIRMPVCDGIEGTKLIKRNHGLIKILILITFDEDPNLFQALINGAEGYILKDVTPDELIRTIKNLTGKERVGRTDG